MLSNFKTHRAAAKPKPFGSYPVNLTNLLPSTPGPEHDNDRNKEDLQDNWHTDAMKKAMPQLRDFLKGCVTADKSFHCACSQKILNNDFHCNVVLVIG